MPNFLTIPADRIDYREFEIGRSVGNEFFGAIDESAQKKRENEAIATLLSALSGNQTQLPEFDQNTYPSGAEKSYLLNLLRGENIDRRNTGTGTGTKKDTSLSDLRRWQIIQNAAGKAGDEQLFEIANTKIAGLLSTLDDRKPSLSDMAGPLNKQFMGGGVMPDNVPMAINDETGEVRPASEVMGNQYQQAPLLARLASNIPDPLDADKNLNAGRAVQQLLQGIFGKEKTKRPSGQEMINGVPSAEYYAQLKDLELTGPGSPGFADKIAAEVPASERIPSKAVKAEYFQNALERLKEQGIENPTAEQLAKEAKQLLESYGWITDPDEATKTMSVMSDISATESQRPGRDNIAQDIENLNRNPENDSDVAKSMKNIGTHRATKGNFEQKKSPKKRKPKGHVKPQDYEKWATAYGLSVQPGQDASGANNDRLVIQGIRSDKAFYDTVTEQDFMNAFIEKQKDMLRRQTPRFQYPMLCPH